VNINYFWTLMWSKINLYYFDWGATFVPRRIWRLHEAGVYSVLVYQETYHKDVYKSIILRARNPIWF
jgi:2-iminoacetate synthase